MTYDPTKPNKHQLAMSDGEIETALARWTAELDSAATAEGWTVWDVRGSDFGPIQVQKYDSPEDLLPLVVPRLNSDNDAFLLVMRGTGDHHRVAREIIAKYNPEDFARMAYVFTQANKEKP